MIDIRKNIGAFRWQLSLSFWPGLFYAMWVPSFVCYIYNVRVGVRVSVTWLFELQEIWWHISIGILEPCRTCTRCGVRQRCTCQNVLITPDGQRGVAAVGGRSPQRGAIRAGTITVVPKFNWLLGVRHTADIPSPNILNWITVFRVQIKVHSTAAARYNLPDSIQ